VIKLFLDFLIFFNALQGHKMFVIMLDPCFKALRIVESLVGHGNVIILAYEYDAKFVIPLSDGMF
jgi:flagellar biosynthesis protein FliR